MNLDKSADFVGRRALEREVRRWRAGAPARRPDGRLPVDRVAVRGAGPAHRRDHAHVARATARSTRARARSGVRRAEHGVRHSSSTSRLRRSSPPSSRPARPWHSNGPWKAGAAVPRLRSCPCPSSTPRANARDPRTKVDQPDEINLTPSARPGHETQVKRSEEPISDPRRKRRARLPRSARPSAGHQRSVGRDREAAGGSKNWRARTMSCSTASTVTPSRCDRSRSSSITATW